MNIPYTVQSIFIFFLIVTSYMSFRLSAGMSALATGLFTWNLVLDTSLKFLSENPNFFHGTKISGNLHEDVSVILLRHVSNIQMFILRMLLLPAPWIRYEKHYCVLPNILILPTVIWVTVHLHSTQRGPCWLSIATTVTRKCHNVKIFVHCLSCCAICRLGDTGGGQRMDNRNCMFRCSTG